MSDQQNGPAPKGIPAPLEHHTVTIAFDVLARSSQEAAYIVRETLMEDLAAPGDTAVVDGDRVFGEDFGENVSSIRSWIPVPASSFTASPEQPPADLLAWEVLQAVVTADSSAPVVLGDEARARLTELLESADRDITVPDPADIKAPPLYEGPASEAHRWLPGGTYRAAAVDGGGTLRLVVSPSAPPRPGASFAFTPAAQDAAAMDRVFFLLEGMSQADAIPTLHALNTVLVYTGRPAADLDLLHPKSDGRTHPLLRGLLERREQTLGSDGPSTGPEAWPGPGLGR